MLLFFCFPVVVSSKSIKKKGTYMLCLELAKCEVLEQLCPFQPRLKGKDCRWYSGKLGAEKREMV